ncbi:Cupin [Paenibacillaceae bacterium GAS479]|nr:Cupin [Paenibacillaceae bacterium GAS479]
MENITQLLQSPSLNLSADSNTTVNYKRDADNYITQLFAEQLPAVQTGFFNVHMSKDKIVQPHWHTNVSELVIVICGEVVTTVFNPFTQKLMTYRLGPGQVSMFPKGWFHWIVTLSDNTHFLTVFDGPTPDIVYGSDFLRFTPKEIMNLAYCVDEEAYAKAVAPIKESIILGPPPGCVKASTPIIQAAPAYASGYGGVSTQPVKQPVAPWNGFQQGYMYQQKAAAPEMWNPVYAQPIQPTGPVNSYSSAPYGGYGSPQAGWGQGVGQAMPYAPAYPYGG